MTDSFLTVIHQQHLLNHRQQTNTMAHDLDLSVTRYYQIKDRLVPKHLATSQNQRKKDFLRKQMRQDLQFDTIQKQKYNRMKPIKEIETIMKHFHSKFSSKQTDFSVKSIPKRKKMFTAHDELQESQRDLHTRISDLIHLPEIKQKRKAAEKYRYYLLADQIKQKQMRKAKIMEEFNSYIEAEMKGNPRNSNNRRLNTIN